MSKCVNGQQHNTYRITAMATNGGDPCPFYHGDANPTKVTCGTPCQGAYVQNSQAGQCFGGWQAKTFTVTQAAAGGGAECDEEDGHIKVESCANPDVDVDWAYMRPADQWDEPLASVNSTEYPTVQCPKGATLAFAWSATGTMKHDVWRLPSEESYQSCDFNAPGAERLAQSATTGTLDFACDAPGTHFFACSVGDACEKGFQKIRVHVTTPKATAAMRENGTATLGLIIRENANYFTNAAYGGGVGIPESDAEKIYQDYRNALQHSPQSCADWYPEGYNSDTLCKASLTTDMGYINRARAIPDFDMAKQYYEETLSEIDPSFCNAASYLAELHVHMPQYDAAKARAALHWHVSCVGKSIHGCSSRHASETLTVQTPQAYHKSVGDNASIVC